MAQIIIFAHRENLAGRKGAISDVIHSCVTAALGIPQDKRFHRFISLEPDDFIHPPDRGPRYTILEISIFEGRSREVKKELIRALFARFERDLGIGPLDLEITIQESPRGNWGIRGQPGDELTVPYKIEI
jgi:phenylpyruvate tautomerase PptA (4-oxalocrotonate tautomerase family)